MIGKDIPSEDWKELVTFLKNCEHVLLLEDLGVARHLPWVLGKPILFLDWTERITFMSTGEDTSLFQNWKECHCSWGLGRMPLSMGTGENTSHSLRTGKYTSLSEDWLVSGSNCRCWRPHSFMGQSVSCCLQLTPILSVSHTPGAAGVGGRLWPSWHRALHHGLYLQLSRSAKWRHKQLHEGLWQATTEGECVRMSLCMSVCYYCTLREGTSTVMGPCLKHFRQSYNIGHFTFSSFTVSSFIFFRSSIALRL